MRPTFHLRQILPSPMILMVLLDFVDPWHLLDLLDRQVRLDHRQDGLQLHHLLMTAKDRELEIDRVRGCFCDLHHSSLNLFQLQ